MTHEQLLAALQALADRGLDYVPHELRHAGYQVMSRSACMGGGELFVLRERPDGGAIQWLIDGHGTLWLPEYWAGQLHEHFDYLAAWYPESPYGSRYAPEERSVDAYEDACTTRDLYAEITGYDAADALVRTEDVETILGPLGFEPCTEADLDPLHTASFDAYLGAGNWGIEGVERRRVGDDGSTDYQGEDWLISHYPQAPPSLIVGEEFDWWVRQQFEATKG